VLDQYREAGIDRALFMVPDATRDEILTVIDRYARVLR
jgi:hypothetical protein